MTDNDSNTANRPRPEPLMAGVWGRHPPFRYRVLVPALLVLSVAITACTAFQRQSAPPGGILNLIRVSNWIDTAGQPSAAQLQELTKQDYQVVINLSPSDVDGSVPREEQLLTRRGISYVHIPVDISSLDLMEFKLFSAILSESRNRKTLVHCQLNMRASIFVFLHQVIREGADPEAAYDQVTAVWVPPRQPWLRYMEQVLNHYGISIPL